jgi:hypothetical protein
MDTQHNHSHAQTQKEIKSQQTQEKDWVLKIVTLVVIFLQTLFEKEQISNAITPEDGEKPLDSIKSLLTYVSKLAEIPEKSFYNLLSTQTNIEAQINGAEDSVKALIPKFVGENGEHIHYTDYDKNTLLSEVNKLYNYRAELCVNNAERTKQDYLISVMDTIHTTLSKLIIDHNSVNLIKQCLKDCKQNLPAQSVIPVLENEELKEQIKNLKWRFQYNDKQLKAEADAKAKQEEVCSHIQDLTSKVENLIHELSGFMKNDTERKHVNDSDGVFIEPSDEYNKYLATLGKKMLPLLETAALASAWVKVNSKSC